MFRGLFQWWMFSQFYFQKNMVLPCCFWKDNLSKLDMVHICFKYAVTCTSVRSLDKFLILILSSDKCLCSTNRLAITILYVVCQTILYFCLIQVYFRYPYSILTGRYCNLILKMVLLFDTHFFYLFSTYQKISIYMSQFLEDLPGHENCCKKY